MFAKEGLGKSGLQEFYYYHGEWFELCKQLKVTTQFQPQQISQNSWVLRKSDKIEPDYTNPKVVESDESKEKKHNRLNNGKQEADINSREPCPSDHGTRERCYYQHLGHSTQKTVGGERDAKSGMEF